MSDAAWALELVEDEGLDGRCAADPREAARVAAALRARPSADKPSLLFYFAQRNCEKLVQLLLADGLSPNTIYPEHGMSTLMHVAARAGSVGVLRLLLLVSVDAMSRDVLGNTPLMVAVREGNLVCTCDLLGWHLGHRTLDLRQFNAGGFNVLHECMFSSLPVSFTTDVSVTDRTEILKLLLPHFADIDVRTVKGRPPAVPDGPYDCTPLHIACGNGLHAIAKALLAAGASRTAHDNNSVSCLHVAAKNGHLACVTLLIGRPGNQKMSAAEIDAQNRCGQTPLHLASHGGHRYCCAALLAAGADPAVTAHGRTALDVAKLFHPGNRELIELLECRGGGPAPLLCAGCGASDKRVRACSACGSAAFCSGACLIQFWPVHKAECKRIQAEKEEQTRSWQADRWLGIEARALAQPFSKAAADAAVKQRLAIAAAAETQRFADAQAAADAAMAELLAEEAASSASAAAAKAKSAKAKAKKKAKAKGGAGPSSAAEEPPDEPQDEPAAPVPAPAAALAQPLAAPPQQPQLRDVPPSPAPAPPPAAQQLAAPSFESLFPWLVVPEAPRPALVPLDAPHEDDLLCVCCLDAPRDTALAGCAGVHADAVCSDCAALLLSRPLPSCPLCRAPC